MSAITRILVLCGAAVVAGGCAAPPSNRDAYEQALA